MDVCTNPIIVVSICDDGDESYLTLDCDHIMGMTVMGTPENIRSFNYITSFYISPIEYEVMSSIINATGDTNIFYQSYSDYGYFGSVTLDLVTNYLSNKSSVDAYTENGYIIIQNVDNDEFLVYDPVTGIIRDINTINNFCGSDLPELPYNIIYPNDYVFYPPDGTTVYINPNYVMVTDTWYNVIGIITGDWYDPIDNPGTYGFPFGSTYSYGPFNFTYDGDGPVFIAGGYWFWAWENPSYDPYLYSIGTMSIQVNNETLPLMGNPKNLTYYLIDIDITKYLHGGPNSIIITINSTIGTVANSYLWVIEEEHAFKYYQLPIPTDWVLYAEHWMQEDETNEGGSSTPPGTNVYTPTISY